MGSIALLVLAGCAAPSQATSVPVSEAPAPSPTPTTAEQLTAEPVGPAHVPAATPTLTVRASTDDTRTGTELDEPFTVEGIVVVSKDHRISASYVPPSANQRLGLLPDAYSAFQTMAQAAKKDGMTLTIRSGYRSYSTQKASFEKALRTYDEATARRYFAEPGASEHQTGLALDAWDGVNRGTAFTATAEAAWLAGHAYEYGFIVRYPEGKTDITGYAYESWHLRWVGKDIAADFGPNSSLTLEEYLGLA